MTTTPFVSSSTARRLSRTIGGCLLMVACSSPVSAQAPAAPADAPKPFSEWSESVHSFRDSLVAAAKAQVGTKYVRGGQSPERGFDCSGLVRYVLGGLRIDIPRTAAQQAAAGRAVTRDKSRLRPGDLLTFGRGKRGVSHIGIYVGNGRYVHASSVAGRVIESDIERPKSPLIRNWRGARRVVASEADTVSQSPAKGDG